MAWSYVLRYACVCVDLCACVGEVEFGGTWEVLEVSAPGLSPQRSVFLGAHIIGLSQLVFPAFENPH
jgi:hypothetical protein